MAQFVCPENPTVPSINVHDISNPAPPFLVPNNCENNVFNTDNQNNNQNNPNISQHKKTNINGFCYHIGVLIFAPSFSVLKNSSLGECKTYIMQWLIAILLGVKNIEQSKLLNYSSLNLFLDNPIRNLHQQRKMLKGYATKENIEKALSFNCGLVGANKKTNFYYDPHTKHYTGIRKILKSWCSKVRIADKVINADFIHTEDGFPVYINNGDTFDDMRVRFFKDVKEFRRIANIPDNVIITMNVDRGIFSMDVFEMALELKNLHITTWEKGYKNNMWDQKAGTKIGILFKYRNNKTDTKLIKYEYQECKWEKNNEIRQFVIRLPEKNGSGSIEVSILSTDFLGAAQDIIYYMLNRWVQENDFKYLIAHFGLDQITSYGFDDYKEITDTITDKEHTSGQYKALTKELDNLRTRLKTALHKKHEFDAKFGIYQDISQLINEQANELITEFTKEFIKILPEAKTQKPTEKQTENYKKNFKTIIGLSLQFQEKFQERAKTDKLVSKIKELSDNEFQKLGTNAKQFMDIIKIIARNIFYIGFKPFKDEYNNYRDDHVIFRSFSQSNGLINCTDSKMKIGLLPIMELNPKQRKIFEKILLQINEQKISVPKNKNQIISFEIPEKNNSLFAFEN